MKKNGMIMAEVVMALVICGVILAVSINMFRSNDITKTPYLYSVMKNLPMVNKSVMEDCYRDGTCQSPDILPDSIKEYCSRLAENFNVSGTVDCTTQTEGTKNFKLTNGISFGDMLLKGNSWQNITTDKGIVLNSYIDVKIDVNNINQPNEVGNDIFAIRIFKNGETAPISVSSLNNGSLIASDSSPLKANDDEEFFAYRVILNRAQDSDNTNIRVTEVIDARTQAQKNAHDNGTIKLPFREKISFKEAVCKSNPDLIGRYFQDETCDSIQLASACDFTSNSNPYKNDKTAYCTIEPVRPKGSGIFKIFGI